VEEEEACEAEFVDEAELLVQTCERAPSHVLTGCGVALSEGRTADPGQLGDRRLATVREVRVEGVRRRVAEGVEIIANRLDKAR